MKSARIVIITVLLGAFGLLTTFLTSSVILDVFNMRQHQGNYVPLVVWANLVSGICYLAAAFALITKRPWTAKPLIISLFVLIAAFIGLIIHIYTGGAYETKTVGAMIFRIAVNTVFAGLLYVGSKRTKAGTVVKTSLALLFAIALAAGCGQSSDHHDHGAESDEAHHHAVEVSPLQLNNGEKWEADAHTRAVVSEMKRSLSEFAAPRQQDHRFLADTLSDQLNRLIAGCTMTGPAHDELHKWLVPLTEHIKRLSTAEKASASEDLHGIESSLKDFDEYFQ